MTGIKSESLTTFIGISTLGLGGPASGALDDGDFLKADGQGAATNRGVAIQGHEEGSLQKTQAEHQIEKG